jgi:hypothetical protein
MFIIAVSVLTATIVQAHAQQPDQTQNPNAFDREYTSHKTTINGRKSLLNYFFSLKGDCAPTDWIEVKIIKAPENGEAKLIDGNAFPAYTAPNPRVKCNDRSVKAKGLEYVPTKGYAGDDQIIVEMIDNGGSHGTYTFNITVK